MDAERVEVLHVAHGDAVVVAVAHHLIFYLLPTFEALLDEDLWGEREGFLTNLAQLVVVVGKAGAEATQGIGSADDDGVAEVFGSLEGRRHILAGFALDGVNVNLIEFLDEALAVLGIHDGLDGRAEDFDVVFLQDAALLQLDAAVQGRLTTEGEENAVRMLLGDDTLHEIGLYGEEVDLVGHTLGSLHRGDVGVDEDCLDALLTQRLEGLRAGIVKLAGFAYLQGTGAKQKNFFYIRVSHFLSSVISVSL